MIYSLKENPETVFSIVALRHNGDFVGQYDNISDAAFKLNIYPANIVKCFHGKSNGTKDYIFIKADNYNPNIKITKASIARKKSFLNNKKR